ncbi:MAG TPA: ATP-binding protein [Rhizomicrobium sp.]|nr:ATP-binding protein [Rhizomicrobium sp.]
MRTACLHGPESTGKTTLARELAVHFSSVVVPEFGRLYCEIFGNACDVEDLRAIRHGHDLFAAAGRRKARGILILDTDAVMTAIWADILTGARPADLDRIDDPADLYLLCDIDVPFAPDSIRYFPDASMRAKMFTQCRAELEKRKLAFVTIRGSRGQRFAEAVKAITEHFPELAAA